MLKCLFSEFTLLYILYWFSSALHWTHMSLKYLTNLKIIITASIYITVLIAHIVFPEQLQVIVSIIAFWFPGRPCFPIYKPINGNNNCSGYVTEDTCDFDCLPGYKLIGSKTRTCGPNKQWTGNNPECKRKWNLYFMKCWKMYLRISTWYLQALVLLEHSVLRE